MGAREDVRLDIAHGVAVITSERPQARNAIGLSAIAEPGQVRPAVHRETLAEAIRSPAERWTALEHRRKVEEAETARRAHRVAEAS